MEMCFVAFNRKVHGAKANKGKVIISTRVKNPDSCSACLSNGQLALTRYYFTKSCFHFGPNRHGFISSTRLLREFFFMSFK